MRTGGGLSSLEAEIDLARKSQGGLVKRAVMDGEAGFNPYAPPRAVTLVDESSPEAIRRVHIGHETSVRAIGSLHAMLGGMMLLPVLMGLLEAAISTSLWRSDFVPLMTALAIGAGLLFLGANLRQLQPWARIAMAVVSGLLAAITLFTVIFPALNFYVLWLMLSARGRMVFSPAYQHTIALTPDMRPGVSESSRFLLCLVVLLVLAALMIPVFRR